MLNIQLDEDQWTQATLSVRYGGLGIRQATELALPAFLASVSGSQELISQILPTQLHDTSGIRDNDYTIGCTKWSMLLDGVFLPEGETAAIQKSWDLPLMAMKTTSMLETATTQTSKARLIAVTAPHAGDFLEAIPMSATGTRLDRNSLRISIALRIGAPICTPHQCVCGQMVDAYGTHGLSCLKSAGRYARHSAVNDIIKRALVSAKIPAKLEP